MVHSANILHGLPPCHTRSVLCRGKPSTPSIDNADKLKAYVELVGDAVNCRHLRIHGLPLAAQESDVAPDEAWLWKVHADPVVFQKLACYFASAYYHSERFNVATQGWVAGKAWT